MKYHMATLYYDTNTSEGGVKFHFKGNKKECDYIFYIDCIQDWISDLELKAEKIQAEEKRRYQEKKKP